MVKVHLRRFENLPFVRVQIKTILCKFCILNPTGFFAKCLFTNIQKQRNALKSSLLFKKNATFTGQKLEHLQD